MPGRAQGSEECSADYSDAALHASQSTSAMNKRVKSLSRKKGSSNTKRAQTRIRSWGVNELSSLSLPPMRDATGGIEVAKCGVDHLVDTRREALPLAYPAPLTNQCKMETNSELMFQYPAKSIDESEKKRKKKTSREVICRTPDVYKASPKKVNSGTLRLPLLTRNENACMRPLAQNHDSLPHTTKNQKRQIDDLNSCRVYDLCGAYQVLFLSPHAMMFPSGTVKSTKKKRV
eukprot:GEMP01041870.1.p1 GENE.GEMP01041870.1~~GEMP01041870.1.p1  ORF type:complete len:232 (+),score=45.12 GEMP01041870.1:677-1372(+)